MDELSGRNRTTKINWKDKLTAVTNPHPIPPPPDLKNQRTINPPPRQHGPPPPPSKEEEEECIEVTRRRKGHSLTQSLDFRNRLEAEEADVLLSPSCSVGGHLQEVWECHLRPVLDVVGPALSLSPPSASSLDGALHDGCLMMWPNHASFCRLSFVRRGS